MPKKNFPSRVLRHLAEDCVRVLAERGAIAESEQDDLATSLVRQWLTYEGIATLFLGEDQAYFVLGKTPLGKPCVVPEPDSSGWMSRVTRDWKVNPEEVPDLLDQLNRGQSAEVTNDDGVPLRLWANPRERSVGVEPLVKEKRPPPSERDYRKIAFNSVEEQFGESVDEDEMAALISSVVRQWKEYDGHACLFVECSMIAFTLTELGEGNCRVSTERRRASIESLLRSLGFPSESIPEVIVRINLNQRIEFRDRNGVRSHLWHDPKTRRLCVRAVDPVPATPRSGPLPIFCPKCGAVLPLEQRGTRAPHCHECGQLYD